MNENQTSFQYTYCAKEQEELKRIRSKYLPREEDKLELVRRLDAQVTRKAAAYAVTDGVLGTLVFGVGLCCCLVWGSYMLGVMVGVVGMALLALAYPLHIRIAQKERRRIAPQILRLTEELMK